MIRTPNNKGFSLVELMVVVAIIGILSAIAIPQINKYMARARQTEAKTNLASIYTANKAFYAEYNVYDTHFDTIGYRPEGRLRYHLGWQSCAGTDLTKYGYNSVSTAATKNDCESNSFCKNSMQDTKYVCTQLADGEGKSLPKTDIDAEKSFTAGAASKISTGKNDDQWTIDEVKQLTNVLDGTQ